MAERGYEFFDHTADVGITATGETLDALFVHMAQGLIELIAENSRLEPRQKRLIQLEAESTASLLLAWLKELLFWFSSDGFLPARFEIDDVTPTTLRGRVVGEAFDPLRHVSGTEVKGITRHQLRVKRVDDGWEAHVIVDV